jgi:DNA-binding response OmpR family regulator
MENILVIDDDMELCELLAEYLSPEGFTVDSAHNGETGLEMALNGKHSIVVLDIMLPGGNNGFDILQLIRSKTNIPVIMLTARGNDIDRIIGLEMGADDYIPKPFNPRELLARIRAVLRRSKYMLQEISAGSIPKKYKIGDIELDLSARQVVRANEPVKLTNVEFNILAALMSNFGEVVSRENLSNDVLERPLLPYDRSIDVHVSNLRKKLGPENGCQERIKSIRNAGYIYVTSSFKDNNELYDSENISIKKDDSNAKA